MISFSLSKMKDSVTIRQRKCKLRNLLQQMAKTSRGCLLAGMPSFDPEFLMASLQIFSL